MRVLHTMPDWPLCCAWAGDLTRGFGLVGAIGFTGSLAVETLSWAAWETFVIAACSVWMRSMRCQSCASWPPLPLVGLEEQHVVWVSVTPIKKSRQVKWHLRRKKNVPAPGFTFFIFLCVSRPSSDVSCWDDRFRGILKGLVTSKTREAQELTSRSLAINIACYTPNPHGQLVNACSGSSVI